ncbi:MAG TPA: hypothetical protein VFM46_05125 [Pseudomonadales bacterium]|nr:hypothetical protein [Pseudomonadales bacterium]
MKKHLVLLTCLSCLLPAIAQAYVGPGAGLSAIGSFLALILGLFVAILGFVWYPIKRLIKGKKGATLENAELAAATVEATDTGARK